MELGELELCGDAGVKNWLGLAPWICSTQAGGDMGKETFSSYGSPGLQRVGRKPISGSALAEPPLEQEGECMCTYVLRFLLHLLKSTTLCLAPLVSMRLSAAVSLVTLLYGCINI